MTKAAGWLSLGDDESGRLIAEVEVSPQIWEAFEGNLHPLPTPSVEYDFGNLLYVAPPPSGSMAAAIDPGEERPDFQRLLDDFYAKALLALRSVTIPETFIFALTCEYSGYLFWPHRAVRGEPWPLRVPGPEAYYSFYAPTDFSWGFFFGWYSATIFGQPLLHAFERNNPELLTKITAIDGVDLEPRQPPTEAQEAGDRVSRIMFLTGFNYALCPEGPWTSELVRLHDTFERTRARDDLVKLIVKIEQILGEQGIEHTPCVPLDDQDD